jgi:hypothetical protein
MRTNCGLGLRTFSLTLCRLMTAHEGRRPATMDPEEGLPERVEQGFPRVAHMPALIVWGRPGPAFKEAQRLPVGARARRRS